MNWYVWLGSYLPPILMILGYVIRLEGRISRIEGKLDIMLKNCGGEDNGQKEKKGKGSHVL